MRQREEENRRRRMARRIKRILRLAQQEHDPRVMGVAKDLLHETSGMVCALIPAEERKGASLAHRCMTTLVRLDWSPAIWGILAACLEEGATDEEAAHFPLLPHQGGSLTLQRLAALALYLECKRELAKSSSASV